MPYRLYDSEEFDDCSRGWDKGHIEDCATLKQAIMRSIQLMQWWDDSLFDVTLVYYDAKHKPMVVATIYDDNSIDYAEQNRNRRKSDAEYRLTWENHKKGSVLFDFKGRRITYGSMGERYVNGKREDW